MTNKADTTSASNRINQTKWHTLMWAIICVGIFLRLFHFFYNRSLWTDEVYLGNSLIRMGFLELANGPLEYEQKAPIGFLWMVKLCVLAFGKGEMALRLFSLLCGILSLFLFKSVANKVVSSRGVAIGLAILALGPPLVYHAVEAKHYSTELLATLVSLNLYFRFHQRKDIPALTVWGLWGGLICWFSYAAIFILAGIAFGTCLYYLIKAHWKSLFLSIIPFTIWLVSFGVNYFLFTHKYADSEWLVLWFGNLKSFMPFPPSTVSDLTWFISMPLSMLHFTLGLSWLDLSYEHSNLIRGLLRMPFLPISLWIMGMMIIFRENQKLFWVLVFPFLLSMLASGMKIYPMFERLMLFLAPIIILFIVRGCETILNYLSNKRWQYAFSVLLIVGAAWNSASMLLDPSQFGRHFKNMNAREALLYANERYQPGDVVYIYWNLEPFYRFYKESYKLKYKATIGSDVRMASLGPDDYVSKLSNDFQKLDNGERVWYIYHKYRKFSIGNDHTKHDPLHWYNNEDVKPGILGEQSLLKTGKKLDYFSKNDVSLTLFKLSNR